MSFPQKTKFLRRCVGWKDLGKIKGKYLRQEEGSIVR